LDVGEGRFKDRVRYGLGAFICRIWVKLFPKNRNRILLFYDSTELKQKKRIFEEKKLNEASKDAILANIKLAPTFLSRVLFVLKNRKSNAVRTN